MGGFPHLIQMNEITMLKMVITGTFVNFTVSIPVPIGYR